MKNALTTLGEMIGRLTPIHQALERFERGGAERAREIERLYNELVFIEARLIQLDDDVAEDNET
jgi:hypothetical protein